MSSGAPGPGAEQVDGLVAELALLGRRDRVGGVRGLARRRRRSAVASPAAIGRPRDAVERALEQAEQALAAGVDDVRLAQDRQQGRRLRDGALGGVEGRGEHRLDVVVALGGGDRGGRRLADDREDRALDRLGDGLVGRLRALVERVREVEAVEPPLAGEAVRHAGQDLAGDDAGVAAGAHQRPEAHGLGHPLDVGVGADLVGLLERGADRGQHVRAGVAVRDREHVERVDLVDVRLEARDRAPEGRQEPGAVARPARPSGDVRPAARRGRPGPARGCAGRRPAGARGPGHGRRCPIRIEIRSGSRPSASTQGVADRRVDLARDLGDRQAVGDRRGPRSTVSASPTSSRRPGCATPSRSRRRPTGPPPAKPVTP